MSGNVGAPALSPNTANDASVAAPMPDVPKDTPRMRPSDFAKQRREGALPARAPAPAEPQRPQTTRERIGEFSRQLEAKQNGEQPELEQREARQLPAPKASELPEKREDAEANPELGEPGTALEVDDSVRAEVMSDEEVVAKWREWERSDLAPEELFADKLHPVKVRGQERYVDYAELKQGYMRHGDYTQRGLELKQREEQVQRSETTYKEHFEAIRDPEQFLEIYERSGYGDTLEKVAERIAERRIEHRNLVRAAGRAAAERLGFTSQQINAGQADNHREVVEAMTKADARLKQTRSVEIENRRLSAERERFETEKKERAHAAEVAKHQATYDKQISQLRPGALRAHGIQDTPQNRVAFLRHLKGVMELQGLGDEGFTRPMVMAAARNLKEEQEDTLSNEAGVGRMSEAEQRAKKQAEQRARALSGARVGTGSGKPLAQPGSQRMRPSDFARQRRDGSLGR